MAAGVIMLLLAGILYAWSILKTPLAAEFGWDSTQLGLNFTITMCGFCVGGVLGGIITKKLSPRLTVILAALVIFAGFFGSSRLSDSLVLLYVFYGGFAGIGIGVSYNVVISTVTKWFPDKRATVSGALMMGFGASTLILGPIMNGLIDSSGWRNAYFLLGLAILIVLVIGAFFLKQPDERIHTLRDGGKKKISEVGEDTATSQMVKKTSFWKAYCLQLLICAVGTCVISLAKDVSLSVGAADSVAVLLVGILSVCNGLGRILFGFFFDTIGRRKTMLLSCVTAILACVIMLSAILTGSASLMSVGLVLTGFAYGSMPPISSGVASSFFGAKHFALNFSVLNTMLIPASFAATIAGAILGSTGNYVPVFVMLLCFSLGAFIINLSLKKA